MLLTLTKYLFVGFVNLSKKTFYGKANFFVHCHSIEAEFITMRLYVHEIICYRRSFKINIKVGIYKLNGANLET